MRSKIAVLMVSLLATAVWARALPQPGPEPKHCKQDRRRLEQEERVLRDQQKVAMDQCVLAAGEHSARCEQLRVSQRNDMRAFEEREKTALQGCKHRAKEERKEEKRKLKEENKEEKREEKREEKQEHKPPPKL